MTDNENFKADTEELFNKLKTYKKKYSFMSGGRMNQKGADILEDEENAKQRQWDSYC